jgi:RHS repeat-associated protein
VENRWIGENVFSNGVEHETRFAYDGNQIVLEFDKVISSPLPSGEGQGEGTGTVPLGVKDLTHRYLWQPNAVDQLMADEQVHFDSQQGLVTDRLVLALTDNLGTVRDLAFYDAQTQTTTVVNHRVYDSCGVLVSQTDSTIVCLIGFTGRPSDPATDLQNNLHRWYDPVIAGWFSVDPKGFDGGQTNLYVYCGNSPTNAVDPTGLAWWNLWLADLGYELGDRIGAGYAALVGNGFELDMKLAAFQQQQLILGIASPNSQMTSAQIASEELAILKNALGKALDTAFKVADGAVAAGELTACVVSVVVDGVAAISVSDSVVTSLGNEIKQFLGDGSRMIVNDAGDRIFVSKDGLRRVQFHFNNTSPHASPHIHIDVNNGNNWVKKRYYPKDVPPH